MPSTLSSASIGIKQLLTRYRAFPCHVVLPFVTVSESGRRAATSGTDHRDHICSNIISSLPDCRFVLCHLKSASDERTLSAPSDLFEARAHFAFLGER